ncbi:MAG TPA: rod shape-determining protein RodA [Gammaproteobacteria bacterium]|nr:rod shape-determining protein RodA [Gammaproteobacteria bacterium]
MPLVEGSPSLRDSLPARIARVLRLDLPLLAGLLAIAAFGLAVVYSAGGENGALLWRQTLRVAIALAALVVAAQFPPHTLRQWTPWVFAAGLALLIVVEIAGDIGKGAQRWLDLGFMRFQPSELMKLAVPMMVAWYLHARPLPPTLGEVIVSVLIIVVPAVLIARQPDLGTAILVGSAGALALFLAGLRWRLILTALAACSAAAWYLWPRLHEYQRQRILTFLDPQRDPLGSGYHTIQSTIAIGSGGVFGKGWLNGTQSQLEFLPERHTDFIFAVIGEEFGLIGALLLLALYAFVIGRGFVIALRAERTYDRIVAGSIALTFFIYVFVNIGMVAGLLPVVGVPLPLVSYGGTSMVTLFVGFGMLMSIHSQRKFMSP